MIMALSMDIHRVEEIAGYAFGYMETLGVALQSAERDLNEATGQLNISDGNRRLAKLGLKIIELNLTRAWFQRELTHRMKASSRTEAFANPGTEQFDVIQKRFTNKDYLGDTAQQLGLASCLVISQRQEGIAPPPTTLKNGLTAIIAAIWEDSGQDLNIVDKVMEKWGDVIKPKHSADETDSETDSTSGIFLLRGDDM